jgi:hypothetical protein
MCVLFAGWRAISGEKLIFFLCNTPAAQKGGGHYTLARFACCVRPIAGGFFLQTWLAFM